MKKLVMILIAVGALGLIGFLVWYQKSMTVSENRNGTVTRKIGENEQNVNTNSNVTSTRTGTVDTVCSPLNESECKDTKNCYVRYVQKGPSRDSVGMPLVNYYFDTCIALSIEEKARLQQEENDCKASGGYWMRMMTTDEPKGKCVQ